MTDRSILNFLDRGDGWVIAVLETEEEYRFVRHNERFLGSLGDFYIGGSRYPESTGNADVSYCGYSPTQSSNVASVNYVPTVIISN